MSPGINTQQNDLNPVAENVRRKIRELELNKNDVSPSKSDKKSKGSTPFPKAMPRTVKFFTFLGAISLALYLSVYPPSVFVEQINSLLPSQTNKPAFSQTKPTSAASFEVINVMHEITPVDNGNLLKITATVKNSGSEAGQMDSLIVTLYDKGGKPLFSWPAPVSNDFIEASSSVPFEARLADPPADFASVRVQPD